MGRAERSQVKFQIRPAHLTLAAVVCVGLFAGGYLLGRSGQAGNVDDGAEGAVTNAEQNQSSRSTIDPAGVTVSEGRVSVRSVEQGEDQSQTVAVEALEAALEEIDLATVTFAPGSADLSDQAEETLVRVAQVVIDHPLVPVEVETSTFTESTAGENHGLSVQQAEAIVSFLVDNGVDRERLVAVGLGSPLEVGFGQQAILLFDTEDEALAADLNRPDPLAFDLDEDDSISEAGQTMLDQLTRLLDLHPDASLRLLGYVSPRFAGDHHERSHFVADTAADYLADRGVPRSRLETVGLGDSMASLGLQTIVELEVGFPAASTIAINGVDLDQLTFRTGTAELTDSGLTAVAALAEAMSLDPAARVELSVHTYTEADSEQNHDLSHLQGDSIVAALVDLGVAVDRVIVLGHGDPPQFARAGRETYVTVYPVE